MNGYEAYLVLAEAADPNVKLSETSIAPPEGYSPRAAHICPKCGGRMVPAGGIHKPGDKTPAGPWYCPRCRDGKDTKEIWTKNSVVDESLVDYIREGREDKARAKQEVNDAKEEYKKAKANGDEEARRAAHRKLANARINRSNVWCGGRYTSNGTTTPGYAYY